MQDALVILIVDDEPGMLLGAQRVLRGFTVHVPDVDGEVRFEIDTAATGEEALAKIAQRRPDILLLDYKLPGINGLDVLRQVSESGAGTLAIMITAYASLETAVTATKQGAYDFLAKPFTPAELKNVVGKAAGRIVLARQARKLEAEKRRVRFQFISVLAHELKAPLAAVQGYLNILRDHTLGEELSAYEKMVDRSLVRLDGMRKLIFDLLDLTRIESGEKRRDFARVDVREVAEGVIEMFAPAAAERSIAVELHAPERLEMSADRGELEIILNNLVSNGIKYNREGGRVDVALEADAERVSLRVSDTGIGLAAEEAGRLFADFVRIKNDQTRNILGSGLGLSTVKKLAALYGGEAGVESTPGEGSTFLVTLGRFTQPEGERDDARRDSQLASGE